MSLTLEQQLADANRKIEILMENMPGGFFTYDANTAKLLELGNGLLDMFGCDEQTLRDTFYNSFDMMIYKEDRAQTKESIAYQSQTEGNIHVSFRIKGMLSDVMYVEYRGRKVQESNGDVKFYVVLTDVTEQILAQQEMSRVNTALYERNVLNLAKQEAMQNQIRMDDMTGILNKMTIEKSIRDFLEHEAADGLHAMMMIDTDNFKAVNDTLGHLFGDEVIKFAARAIKNTFRQSDYVGRIGGDEFMVFMKNTTREVTEQRAQSLNKALCRKFEKDGKSIAISCSIGIAYYPKDGMDYDALMANADDALYRAKEKGKNRYVIA